MSVQNTGAETQSTIRSVPILRPIGGCLVAVITWAIVGVALGIPAMPIDEQVFGTSFAASDTAGPCLTAAILGGMAAGALVYAFVLSPNALIWLPIKVRLQKLIKKKRATNSQPINTASGDAIADSSPAYEEE